MAFNSPTFLYYPYQPKNSSNPHLWQLQCNPPCKTTLQSFQNSLEGTRLLEEVYSNMGSSKRLGQIIGSWRKRKKGHFVVYAREGKRFVVPLYYLNHPIFRVLLEMAEEEFGSTIHGPLQVPCEEELMEFIVALLRKNPSMEVEKAVLSIATCRGASVTSLFPSFHASNNQPGHRRMVA